MNIKYNLAKLTVGAANISYILYNSLSDDKKIGYGFWNIIIGLLLTFMVIKSVEFVKNQECTWIFLISAIVSIPFNIKLTLIAVNLYLIDSFILTKIFFGVVIYLCILSAEEILLGVVTRIIWTRQNESFLYSINKLEEHEFINQKG